MPRKSDADTMDSDAHQLQSTMEDFTHHSREIARHAGKVAQDSFKKPTTKAALVGAAAMGAVFTVGLVQTAIGGTAAYVAYHLLRKRKAEKDGEGGPA
jgi:hypothetical protein